MATRISGPAPCSICGAERTVIEATRGDICAELSCRRASFHRAEMAKKKAFKAACDDVFAKTGKQTDVTAPVPYLDRKVVETPEKSKRSFRATLRKEIRAAVAAPDQSSAAEYKEPEASSPALNASCIACRGRCCRLGGTHAFLDLENMQMLLAQRQEDSPSAVYRDYIRQIPDQSMEQACLFQGEHGCALPSHMRSSVCHSFECDERLALKAALNGREDASALVIAMDGKEVKAALIAKPGEDLEWVEN